MSLTREERDECLDLIEKQREGLLSDLDSDRLKQWAVDNRDAAWLYITAMELQAGLAWKLGEQGGEEQLDSLHVENIVALSVATLRAESSEGDEASAVIIEVQPDALSRRHKRFDSIHPQRHKFRFSTFSAVMTALAWIGFGCFMWLSTLPDATHPKGDGINVNFVARITGQYGHRWAESTRGIPWHAFLVPGERLNLVEGLIEITFYDGAKVVLEGPAEFVVDSTGAGTLEVGKLTARAHNGFSIATPNANFVDLGTAFGVEVGKDGVDALYVFEGEVRVELKDTTASYENIVVTAGEGVTVTSEHEMSQPSSMEHVHFVRALPRRRSVVSLERSRIETDFTTLSNPGNGWSHGVDNGTVETLFSNNAAFAHADASSSWTWPSPGFPPVHMHNAIISKGATVGHWDDTMTSVAGQFYHVWSQADHSAVIGGQTYDSSDELFSTWTVDVAGSYDILGVWTQPVDETDGSQTIDVLVNGSSLGSKSISAGGSGSDSISSSSVALSVGDTVSFRTTPSDPTAGMIALDATIRRTNSVASEREVSE